MIEKLMTMLVGILLALAGWSLSRTFELSTIQAVHEDKVQKLERQVIKLEDKIRDEVDRRGKKKLFDKIMDNEWYAMGITPGVEEGFEYTAEYFKIPPTLDDYTKDMIKELKNMMDDKPLNQPWRIKPKDWLKKDKPTEWPEGFGPKASALPPTPMPDQKLVASMPQINQQTGLTRTQSALLSPSEQVIARKT